MRRFEIVEQSDGNWKAKFKCTRNNIYNGKEAIGQTPLNAVSILMDDVNIARMVRDTMSSINRNNRCRNPEKRLLDAVFRSRIEETT